MTIKEALETAEIDRLDAEILLSSVLDCSREHLLSHGEVMLSPEQVETWEELHQRRLDKEPIAYITGEKEFFGRSFLVTPDVLIPRPATEGLVELALDFLKTGKGEVRDIDTDVIAIAVSLGDTNNVKNIIDVGTGSGCIAITLKTERPDLEVYATDISSAALEVAATNAKRSVVKIYNSQSFLLDDAQNIEEDFVIVSNPPYIPEDEPLMKDVVDFEPHTALFSGKDGADLLRKLINQAVSNPRCKGLVIECRKEHQKLFENL